MSSKQDRGLYEKYLIQRTDGDPEGKHAECRYFVLDIQHDPHALPALRAYATSIREEYPNLAADLREVTDPGMSKSALYEVIMPAETLADRIRSDGKLFQSGYETGWLEAFRAQEGQS